MVSLIAAAALTIVLLIVGVRFIEPRFAFFPTAGETTTPAEFGAPFEASTVDTRDGEHLRVWILRQAQPRATIVYFHGNGGNLSIWAPILAGIHRRGFTIFAFDYRGYGASTGRPTERGLYRDVDAIVDRAWRDHTGREPIVYWGRSLGATMAAYAATVHAPAAIILESGFPDARSLVRSLPPLAFLSLFSTYRFPTADLMRGLIMPALVMHGDADTVIPYDLGRQLFDRVGGPKRFITLRGADHNDVSPPDPREYWKAVDEFVAAAHLAENASSTLPGSPRH